MERKKKGRLYIPEGNLRHVSKGDKIFIKNEICTVMRTTHTIRLDSWKRNVVIQSIKGDVSGKEYGPMSLERIQRYLFKPNPPERKYATNIKVKVVSPVRAIINN